MSVVSPRIYVADLAAYNNAILRGVWIDAAQDPEEIQAEIDEMLSESPEPIAEEWAIHDYEGFGGLSLGEYESIEHVARVAQLLEEHGEWFGRVVEHVGGLRQLDEAEKMVEERYQGAYDSLEDWAYQFATESSDVEKDCGPYASYIDWERFANDAEMSGDVVSIEDEDGRQHIFWNH